MVPPHIASFSSLALSVHHIPLGHPAWSSWTPWSVCSASCSPARRHRHRFCARPPHRAPFSLVLLTTVAAPTTLCPGPEAEEEPCLLPGCNRKWPFKLMLALKPWVGPSLGYISSLYQQPPANLFTFLSLLLPQKQAAGVLGAPGLAVVGAVEEACGAGPEPVTSHRHRAWGIFVRGLRPRGRPARLSHAQVPAEDGVVLVRSWEAVLGGRPRSPTYSQPILSSQ